MVLRDLRSDEKSIKTFETPMDYEDFILYNTMGKNNFLQIVGDDCTFDDTNKSIDFSVKESGVNKEQRLKENHICYYSIWVGLMISLCLLFGVGIGTEMNKSVVDNKKLVNEWSEDDEEEVVKEAEEESEVTESQDDNKNKES